MSAPWILTANGNELDLVYPKPSAMPIQDIAHALSQINRFTGHARRPYSVAEHSLLVCEIVERLQPTISAHGLFAALMHDAHEAFIGDVATPTKQMIGAGWHMLEDRIQQTLRSAYALHGPSSLHSHIIKQADLIALATERKQLMPPGGSPWEILQGIEPVGWVDLMCSGRTQMAWSDWRSAFKDRADDLDFARNVGLFKVAQP